MCHCHHGYGRYYHGFYHSECCHPHFRHHIFPSRKEQIEILENYKEWLKEELELVEERLSDLKEKE